MSPLDYTLPLDQLPDPLPIVPLERPFDVTITPPGSKSITNRAYILAALAKGESRIVRPLRADDTDRLLHALCTLGAEAKWVPGRSGDGSEDVLITGVNGRFPRGGVVNLGDGGTPTRFMIAAACLAAEPVVVDGSARMRERPIAEGVDMLRQLGAQIEYVEEEGRLPVRVLPSEGFKGGEITIGRTQSSQFVSALMLAGPSLEQGLNIRFGAAVTSSSYLQMTLKVCEQWWHGPISVPDVDSRVGRFWQHIDGVLPEIVTIKKSAIDGRAFLVESDASSSVFWTIAAWIIPPSRLQVYQFNSLPIQPDLNVIRELKYRKLIDVEFGYDRDLPCGWRLTRGRRTGRIRTDCSLFPDGAMAMIVGSATMKAKSRFTGLHTLRVKETDRIAALANELRKVGCEVETTEDSITIHPIPDLDKRAATVRERSSDTDVDRAKPLPHGRGPEGEPLPHGRGLSERIIIETYNDHRMAMAFAVLGLRVPGIAIRNPACVAKSYPTFWRDFAKLYGQSAEYSEGAEC